MKTSDEMTEIVFRKMAIHELKMKERRRKILRTAVPLMLLLVVAAVSFGVWVSYNPEVFINGSEGGVIVNDPKEPDFLHTNNPFAEIYIDYKCSISQNLNEMVENSELVVRGKLFYIKSFPGNGYLDYFENAPVNVSSGVKYNTTVGKLYEFKISDILKGEAEKNIKVYHNYRDSFNYNEYGFIFDNPYYCGLKNSSEYILFLNKDDESGYYTLATEPGAILILGNNCYLQSNLKSKTINTRYANLLKNDIDTGDLIKINLSFPIIDDDISKQDVTQIIESIQRKVKNYE